MQTRVLSSILEVDAGAWDALAGLDDPFVEHAFLSCLERSGSVGEASGWIPRHVTLWEAGELIGALPLYLKDHSYGEFIFDWAWAQAAERAGIMYYPKLVSMVPVTPVTGCRVLVAEGRERAKLSSELLHGALAVAEEEGASSIHVLFLRSEEMKAIGDASPFMRRLSHQFHWDNDGYRDFEDYLSTFRSAMRKQVRRERRRAADSGLTIRVATGAELTDAEWDALYPLYRQGCMRYGSPDYLTARFFDEAREHLRHRLVAALGSLDGQVMAASFGFEKGACLYGRYWGCVQDYDCLHFELCYYRLIERAIARGMRRFEAGAQGTHKLRRGLMPAPVHSLHWVQDPRLRAAVRDFLPREAFMEQQRMEAFAAHGPFRRGDRQ